MTTNLHFYEVVTHNVKMPTGWLMHADGSWFSMEEGGPLTLNIDASTTEAREIIERAVAETPVLQVVVCYRQTVDSSHLRMLVFKCPEKEMSGYQWDEGNPPWFFWSKDQKNRYDKLSEDDDLNVGHFHVVMDRASMVLEIWGEQVENLGATQADPRLKEAAEKVARALMDFYQLAGAVWSEHSDD
jgi:hypothetical protein